MLLSVSLYAQQNISRLLTKLKTTKSDSSVTYAYRDIIRYYQHSQPDSAVYYAEQGIKLMNEHKYKAGAATLMASIASVDHEQGRIELARRRDAEALRLFTEVNNKDGIAFVNNNLGTIEGKLGNYAEATKYFMEALKIYESTSNKRGVQASYVKLGTINERINNLDKATDYYAKAMEMARTNPDSIAVINLYNNIGVVYGKKAQYKKAMENFQRAIVLCDSLKLDGEEMQSLMNLGIVYDNLDMNDKALEYYGKALKIARDNNYPEDFARTTLNIASVYEKTDPKKALELLKAALDTTQRIGDKNLQMDILDAMITTAKSGHDYKMALSLVEEARALRDSIFNISKAKEIANMQSMYELDKSNEKVKQLTLSEKRNAQKRDIIITVAGVLAFTLVALMFFYRKSQKLNAQLLKREYELSKANTIKDKLFSIIGHDLRGPVANAQHMIDIYRHKETTPAEKKYMLDALAENAGASLDTLDKLLYWGQSQIKGIGMKRSAFNANENIRHILKLVKGTADQKQIDLVNNVIADVEVYADPTHFDFVIRNLLSNAIKFTNAYGTVEIKTDKKSKPGYVVFSITDNGVGIDAARLGQIFEPMASSTMGTANEKGTSIGLMLCKEFVKENGGDIWVESENDKGSVFYFSLLASA